MGIPARAGSPSQPTSKLPSPEHLRTSWDRWPDAVNGAPPPAHSFKSWDEHVLDSSVSCIGAKESVNGITGSIAIPRRLPQSSLPLAVESLAEYYAPESAERYTIIEAVSVIQTPSPENPHLNSPSLFDIANPLTTDVESSSTHINTAAKQRPFSTTGSGPVDPVRAAGPISRHKESVRTQEVESSVVCRQKIFEMYDLGRRIQRNRLRQIQEQGLEVSFIELDDEQVHDRTNLLFTVRIPSCRTYKSLWDVITKFAYDPSIYPKAWKEIIAKAYLDEEFDIKDAVASGQISSSMTGLFEDERSIGRPKKSASEDRPLDAPPVPRGTSPTPSEQEYYYIELKNQLRGLSNKRKLLLFGDDSGKNSGMRGSKRKRTAEAVSQEAGRDLMKPERPEEMCGEIVGAKRTAYPTPETTPKMPSAALKPGRASLRDMKNECSKEAKAQTTKPEMGSSSNVKCGKRTKASAGSALPATRAEAYRWSFRKCFEVVENGSLWGESLAESLCLNYECTPDSLGMKKSQSNDGYPTSKQERYKPGINIPDNSKRKKQMQYLLLGYAAMMEQHARAADNGSSEYPNTWWRTQFQKLCPGDVNSASTLGVVMKESGLFTEQKNPQLFDPVFRTMLMRRFADFERRERPYTDWKLKGKEVTVGILVIDPE